MYYTIQEYHFDNETDMNAALLNNQNGTLITTGIHPDLNLPFAQIEWATQQDMVDWVSTNEALFHNENE